MEKESIKDSISKFFDYFEEAFSIYSNLKPIGEFNAIGVGGSGIASEIFREKVNPIKCFFEGEPPKLEKSVLVSYSGNTIETLSWLKCEKVRNNFIALTSGGKLERIARKLGKKVVPLPKNLQPRASLPFMLVVFSFLLGENYKVSKLLKSALTTKHIVESKAKSLSNQLKEPIHIYSSCSLRAFSYRLKTQLNENSKARAYLNLIPEAFHNEIEAPKTGSYLFFIDKNDVPLLNAFKEAFPEATTFSYVSRENFIEDLYFSDVVSLEYALRKGVNMDEVKEIKKLKSILNVSKEKAFNEEEIFNF